MADIYISTYSVKPTGYLQNGGRWPQRNCLEVVTLDPRKEVWAVKPAGGPSDMAYDAKGALVKIYGPRGGKNASVRMSLDNAMRLAGSLVDGELLTPDFFPWRSRATKTYGPATP